MNDLGRNINTSDPSSSILNATYSMGIWLNEQMRLLRTTVFADLINPAGNRVSANYASLVSAIDDFSSEPNVTNFILGTSTSPLGPRITVSINTHTHTHTLPDARRWHVQAEAQTAGP